MAFREAQQEREINLEAFDVLKRALEARAAELSRPGCPEAFSAMDVAGFFRQWARTLDQAMGQIRDDQEEINVLLALAATPTEAGKCN